VYTGAVAGVGKTTPVKVTVVFAEVEVTGFRQSAALLTVNAEVGVGFTIICLVVTAEVHVPATTLNVIFLVPAVGQDTTNGPGPPVIGVRLGVGVPPSKSHKNVYADNGGVALPV
jgi:hypothetical protein